MKALWFLQYVSVDVHGTIFFNLMADMGLIKE